ncbi:MAG: M24 family metallopeptidase [Gemmatimonadales bacterium]
MTSRRRFLTTSVAAVGAASLSRPARTEAQEPRLPSAIAKLTSMKSQAVAITSAERSARLAKARELMGARGIDALLLTGGTTLRYFTGIRWGLSERLFAVVVPKRGKAFVVTPAFERDRSEEQLALGPLGDEAEILTWEENESPYALVAAGLKARGVTAGTIGVEETVRWVFSDGIAQTLPAVTLVSGTPISAGCRMTKSPAELALMRLASEVTWRAYRAAWESLEDGMTQSRFGELVSAAHRQLGFNGGAGVQTGEYSALPHGSVARQVIRPGTILLIDGGCSVEDYASDLSRTFVLGKPTDKMKRVFDLVRRAQTKALQTARPGLPCEAVDAAARKVIVDGGFGPGYTYFTHRVGHGMGMDGHEWPYLVGGNTLPLEPGMTFSDEPGIYIPGEFGVRLEDDMVITERGAELFTTQSPSLEEPFATA